MSNYPISYIIKVVCHDVDEIQVTAKSKDVKTFVTKYETNINSMATSRRTLCLITCPVLGCRRCRS